MGVGLFQAWKQELRKDVYECEGLGGWTIGTI
jgi:hypothetical protein